MSLIFHSHFPPSTDLINKSFFSFWWWRKIIPLVGVTWTQFKENSIQSNIKLTEFNIMHVFQKHEQ